MSEALLFIFQNKILLLTCKLLCQNTVIYQSSIKKTPQCQFTETKNRFHILGIFHLYDLIDKTFPTFLYGYYTLTKLGTQKCKTNKQTHFREFV